MFLFRKSIPAGLLHILLHHGTSRREIYKYKCGQFVFGGKIVPPGTTIIYPAEIRKVVRERFPDSGAGAYDDQYKSSSSGMQISLKHMGDFALKTPPSNCTQCRCRRRSSTCPH